jgi:hypothetical protein
MGLIAPAPAFAQRTPKEITLTPVEWVCVASRLPTLKQLKSNRVRVPLSRCEQGEALRGGAGLASPNVTAPPESKRALPQNTPSGANLAPRPPLFLSKVQLQCLEKALPRLTEMSQSQVTLDLTDCGRT